MTERSKGVGTLMEDTQSAKLVGNSPIELILFKANNNPNDCIAQNTRRGVKVSNLPDGSVGKPSLDFKIAVSGWYTPERVVIMGNMLRVFPLMYIMKQSMATCLKQPVAWEKMAAWRLWRGRSCWLALLD